MRPLAAIVHAMREVADQKFETPIPGLGRANEIGLLAGALEVFKTTGLERQRLTDAGIAGSAAPGRAFPLSRRQDSGLQRPRRQRRRQRRFIRRAVEEQRGNPVAGRQRNQRQGQCGCQRRQPGQHQRADRRRLGGGDDDVDRHHQPARYRCHAARRRRGRAGAARAATPFTRCRRPPRRSAPSCNWFRRSPRRPTCWRSTPPSRRRGRRGRQGLRGGRLRGQEPGPPDQQGHRGNLHARRQHSRHHRRDAARRSTTYRTRIAEISAIMSGIEVDTAQQRNATQDISQERPGRGHAARWTSRIISFRSRRPRPKPGVWPTMRATRPSNFRNRPKP